MVNQHAKWLRTTNRIEWRRPIPSLNYLLTSHVWRQDHNGFSHQDPGFIDHVVNKKSDVIRVYLPPDANTLLSVADHCLRTRQYINVIVAGKQPQPQYLSIEDAIVHCTKGIGIWDWAGTDRAAEPDVVLACAGDVPTMETLAAVEILHEWFPDLLIRVVNVVDLMRLQDDREHPHGLPDADFDALFTTDTPVVFAYHGYRGSSTDSPTAAATTTTSTCADTSKRAPPQPRSTCASSTGSTASIWHWTSSTASNASARPPPTPANT